MQAFFSLTINHEYDRIDGQSNGVANDDLTIVPAASGAELIRSARIFFKVHNSKLICYTADAEGLKNKTDSLFFWVLCVNHAFYSYTDYPNDINFLKPQYFWTNAQNSTSLQHDEFQDPGQGEPPKNAIGCIGIAISDMDPAAPQEFTIDFKVRKTYWEYHILLRESQTDWNYRIADELGEWHFNLKAQTNKELIFQSETPIAYHKRASERLKLFWKDPGSALQNEHSMVLPFGNYAYKLVNRDNKELTPIYIHL